MFSKKSKLFIQILLPISLAFTSVSAHAVSAAMMMPESASSDITQPPIAPSKDPFQVGAADPTDRRLEISAKRILDDR